MAECKTFLGSLAQNLLRPSLSHCRRRRDGSCPCFAIGLHFDTWHGPDDNYRDTETDIINENGTRLVPGNLSSLLFEQLRVGSKANEGDGFLSLGRGHSVDYFLFFKKYRLRYKNKVVYLHRERYK